MVWQRTFVGNKRLSMSSKSLPIHQPRVAVFDFLNLACKEGNGSEPRSFYSPKPGRRKKIARRSGLTETGVTDEVLLTCGSNRIGVLVESLSDPHTNKVISGIEVAAGKTGYEIAILNILGKPTATTGLDSFEGFIVCCLDESTVDLDFLKDTDKPVTIVGNMNGISGYHNIKTDYQKGAQLAVNHLLEKGCQNIVMMTSADANKTSALDQYLGYRDALKIAGKIWREPITVMAATVEAGMEMAAKMLEKGEFPDGVFINNDWVAAGFLKFLKTMEIGRSAKTAVVGFGNESLCQMIEPAMCSIDFRKELAGSTAMNALIDHIANIKPLMSDSVTVIEPALAIGI